MRNWCRYLWGSTITMSIQNIVAGFISHNAWQLAVGVVLLVFAAMVICVCEE